MFPAEAPSRPRRGSAVHRLTFVPPRNILTLSSYTRLRGLSDIVRPRSRACGSWKMLFLLTLQFHSCPPSCKILSSPPLCPLHRPLLQTCLLRSTRISLPLLALVVNTWWLAINLPPTSLLEIFGGSTMKRQRISLASLCRIAGTLLGAGRAVRKFYVANLLNVSKIFLFSRLG